MKDNWLSVSEVERRNQGLPFPKNWYRGEYSNGRDHDGVHIHEQLSRLTLAQRSRAVTGYEDAYRGVDTRRDCNNRLRAFCDRCEAVNRGQTHQPGYMR